MKKIIILFILILPLSVFSQTWYPIGATWYFNKQEQLQFPAHGFTKYTVIKDTVIASLNSKLLRIDTVLYNGITLGPGSCIVREDNSNVYFYENNSFKLMYNFNLNVGDTLNINLSNANCDSVSPLIVDSIKHIFPNGIDLKVQYLSCRYFYSGPWQGQADTITYKIIERIGTEILRTSTYNRFFFNPICTVGEEFISTFLRCYSDNNILYNDNWYANYNCDTLINGTVGVPSISKEEESISIFPNPANESVIIYSNSKMDKIEIYNFSGMKFNTLYPKNNHANIDIHYYQTGFYFFIIKTNEGVKNNIITKKIIKI
jgi:hypothetical protein